LYVLNFTQKVFLIPEKSEGNTNLGTGPYCGFVCHDTLQSGSWYMPFW